jgi:phytol kinase
MKELPYAVLCAGIVLGSLFFANLMYDTGKIPHHVSRKMSHIGGGIGILLFPFLFSSFWWPLILACGFTLLLLITHLVKPSTFRGTGGAGRLQAFAEVHYPGTAIPIIAIGWGYLHQPWLAVVPLTYLAFGDAITGLVRNHVYKREIKGPWGSLAMILVCLLLAYFMKPYIIGLIGACVATVAEKYTPTRQYVDDNLTVPILSFTVMVILWLAYVNGLLPLG